jgi:peptidoglycan hydrolase-like protein with peptidoglycan-binding domain
VRGRIVALGLSAAVMASAGVVAAGRSWGRGPAQAGAGEATGPATSTVAVSRQDLVARTDVDGTLGYAGDLRVAGQSPSGGNGQGTVTALPAPGTVVERGQSLYSVDNRPVSLLYGDVPAWRRLAAGMPDGPDVKQLESNLVALGHANEAELGVDERFTASTTTTIKRWQKALGLEETGAVELGQAVFLPGAFRVAEVKAEKGSPAPPGQPVLTGTSTRRVVEVDHDATKQALVKAGDKVDVKLSDGKVTPGTIASVGTVAQAKGQDPTKRVVEVVVTLDDPAASGSVDQAPVKVGITSASRKGVLAVPVNALLALAEGGYGVRVMDAAGVGRIVAVSTGLFARGMVEVGGDLSEGDRVEVPTS